MLATLGLPSVPALAATTTTFFSVSASTPAACTATATPLNFGDYDPLVNSDVSNTVIAKCTAGTTYDIGLSAGSYGSGVNDRKMSDFFFGGNPLNYALYQDAARTINWGETVGVDTVVGTPGTGSDQTYTVYGRIPSGQATASGSYSDTITVTITF